MLTLRRPLSAPPVSATRPDKRLVMLVTFDVPLTRAAAIVAVDAAVESGEPLLVVNVAASAMLPTATLFGYEYLGRPDVEESLRAPAALAASLGVEVERLRLCSPHPVDALLELVRERRPGLLVVGPERARLGRRSKRALRRICDQAPCLVWVER